MVAVLVALLLPVVVGVMALSLDGGLLYLQRQKAQSAADAAALAGAYQLYNGSNFSVAPDRGHRHGYAERIHDPVVKRHLAADGVCRGVGHGQPAAALQCHVGGRDRVGHGQRRRSRKHDAPYSKAAILVLATSGTSVTLSGTVGVTATNGSIVVDSTSSSSILSSGTPSITTPELDLSGNIRYSGNNPNKATVTNYSQPSTSDPLASIPAPNSGTLTTQSTSAISLSGTTSRTLLPGVYTGGISLSGSSSVTLTAGGIYYINGGGINMSGSSSISGNGVMIYNTGGGALNLSGTGNISLSPMTSGTYAGITVFQDRSNTASAAMSGGTNINNTGTFYLPSAKLTLSGNSGVGVMGSQFIVNSLTFSGTAGINVSYDSSVASTSGLALVE